jgi:SNF family Na+-dependent transporter
MLLLCGLPLLFMEMTAGQYTRRGPIGALAKICPIFKGKKFKLGIPNIGLVANCYMLLAMFLKTSSI